MVTRALRRARAAIVRQVAQQKDDLLVFDLSQPWTTQPGIFVGPDKTPNIPPFTLEDIVSAAERISGARVTLTIGGVACVWTTSVFPEPP